MAYVFWAYVSGALSWNLPDWIWVFDLFFLLPIQLYVYWWPSGFYLRYIARTIIFFLVIFTVVAQFLQHVGFMKDSEGLRYALITIHTVILHYSMGSAYRTIIPFYSVQPYDPSPMMKACVKKLHVWGHIISVVCNTATSSMTQIVLSENSSGWMRFWGSKAMAWVLTFGGFAGNWPECLVGGYWVWRGMRFCWYWIVIGLRWFGSKGTQLWDSKMVAKVRDWWAVFTGWYKGVRKDAWDALVKRFQWVVGSCSSMVRRGRQGATTTGQRGSDA